MFTGHSIGIIGAGNMGEILIKGILRGELLPAERIIASDLGADKLAGIAKNYGVRTTADNRELVRETSIVLLAVKPQNVTHVLKGIGDELDSNHLLISIAAGVSTGTLHKLAGNGSRLVRVMPNAPAMVGEGMSVLCPAQNVGEDDLALAREIFDSIGRSVVLHDESLMDVVTGLSGSGPAFIFMMIEALSDAGVQLGLSRKVSNLLSAQTVLGAAKMFIDTGRHAGYLKDLVATPGGTTFAGLKELERGNFRSTMMEAVEAATRRSRELGLLREQEQED
ncbi:MAG: pyrroline-5-carboxylate reductase [Candidatus Alcyoniella australis]|nr:pyrroline-5-carboxylate reductase [Candidatus Alcyoniella australis]